MGNYLNSAEKSYIPGKPHPNCFEYFGACDEYFYLQNLYWEKRGYIDEKYTRPETMAGLVRTYVDYFTDTYSRKSVVQPFVFYFDSRFSSFESFKYLADSDYRTVMSLSSGAKPKFLFQYLRFGAITNEDEAEEPEYAQTSKKKKQPKISKDAVELEKREWRELYLENGYLVGLRPKKKAFLYLLANHSTCLPIRMNNIRNKWPRRSYFVNTPEVQKDYNMHKMQVDAWNRLVMNYAQEVKVNNEHEIYFNFFVNAYTTQSYIWWKYSHPETTHLQFRLKLLEQLHELLIPDFPVQSKRNIPHWPGPLTEGCHTKCQKEHCKNKSRSYCKACEASYCDHHM